MPHDNPTQAIINSILTSVAQPESPQLTGVFPFQDIIIMALKAYYRNRPPMPRIDEEGEYVGRPVGW